MDTKTPVAQKKERIRAKTKGSPNWCKFSTAKKGRNLRGTTPIYDAIDDWLAPAMARWIARGKYDRRSPDHLPSTPVARKARS